MRKKLLFPIIICGLATMLIGGCGDKKDTPAPTNVNSAKPAVSSSQAPKATPSNSANEKMVGVKAGIGDSVARWEKDYGTIQGQGKSSPY